MEIEIDKAYNCDCKELLLGMQKMGIKADWCITDPPYGLDIGKMTFTLHKPEKSNAKAAKRDYVGVADWDSDRLTNEYFDLIFSTSTNQIIFGGNYYTDILPPTKSWLVWDKRLPHKRDRNDFADCELAWCSQGVARVFNYMYNGMLQQDKKHPDFRFHPTQKPTQLWYKLLNFYTKEGDVILDPFGGSFSLAVACAKSNRHFITCEKDKHIFEKGQKWLNDVKSQGSIFDL